jgi:hypothetical protein
VNCADIDKLPLSRGKHSRPEEGCCVMEKLALRIRCGVPGVIDPVPDYRFTDSPDDQVSVVISTFLRHWNDAMSDDDRQILEPYTITAIGTATGRADDLKRAWLCADWVVHEYTPAMLRAARLQDDAERLEQLVHLVDRATYEEAEPVLQAACSAAYERRDEAWKAAWAAGAAGAAWAAGAVWAAWAVGAAWAAGAVGAAWAAGAVEAAWADWAAGAADAAWAAAAAEAAEAAWATDAAHSAAEAVRAAGGDWYAQRDAAKEAAQPFFDRAFEPIKRRLHESMLGLVDRMIQVG